VSNVAHRSPGKIVKLGAGFRLLATLDRVDKTLYPSLESAHVMKRKDPFGSDGIAALEIIGIERVKKNMHKTLLLIELFIFSSLI